MQLFSRNKAIIALSLGALALGACGDDVTVPVAPAAPITLSITPPSANMNIGESVNFAVQISGGPSTGGPTLASCTSSSATVATATSATATAGVGSASCRVTAVGAGNATITATSSTGQSAAASVSVSAPAPAITSLAVSPSAAQLAVGGSVTIVPTVQPAGRTATYTYTTSSATIASVTAAGVVTAVAPGVATITVSATGTAAGFTTATINQAVTITVSDRAPGLTTLNVQPSSVALAQGGTQALTASAAGPRASAATITYGTSAPSIATVSTMGVITAVSAGTAVVTVTAQSVEAGAFAASSITALVPVTVSPNAQVAIVNLTRGGSTIDISNVTDQIEANIAIQPNGQTVSEVNLWVCAPAETVAACAARTNGVPAARQSFTASGTQAATVQMYVNTSEFTTPDFTTGADANTLYKNGLRTLVATLTTSPAAGSTIASNSISQVNFNNPDGWTISWTAPANRANDVGNITWYGGPTTPDALTPAAQSGAGSFTVVPVVYTPNRTVVQAVLNLSTACGSNITDRTRPFSATYGTATRDTLAGTFNCTGAASTTAGMAPNVVSGVDNNNNTYGGVTLVAAAGTSIFSDFSNIATSTVGGYRQSLGYRPNNLYLPHDYAAPSITAFDVRGGGASGVDSAWVNAAYFVAGTNAVTATGTGSLRYRISDGNVGLTSANGAEIGAGAASRNTLFSVCVNPLPATTPTAPINCTSPVATGGISSTIATLNVPEASNLTNTAYYAQAAETDRLGNRATTVAFTWANASAGTGASATAGLNTTAAVPAAFGVDLTPPTLVAIPNSGDAFPITGFTRTDRDSMYVSAASGITTTTTGVPQADAATFAVRFTDSRSGFFACTATSTNCFGNNVANVRGGSFQIVRRSAPAALSLTGDATVENLVGSSTTSGLTFRNSIDASVYAGDASVRQFSVFVGGVSGRNNATTVPANIGTTAPAYYTFSGTLADRAGNTTAIPARSVAFDNAAPQITGITVPGVLQGGTTVGFGPAGTDDLEAIAGDLALAYRQIGRANGTVVGATTQPQRIRFLRVPNYTSTGLLGLWHNPFAAISDNKLTTPVGPGTTLASSALNVPIPFIQQLTTVDGAGAPLSAAAITALGAEVKPDTVAANLFDIRATSTTVWSDQGRSAALVASIFPSQVPTATKNWTASGAGISTFTAFNPASANLEFRVETSTSITNPPFSSVYVIRAGATEWEHLGTATFAGTLDQGGLRFFRYTFSFGGVSQGQFTQAALANGDVVRAIGVDAAGNALSTLNVTFGLAPAFPGSVTASAAAGTALATINDDNTGGGTRIVSVSANPNAAAISYSCVSSNPGLLTATMGGAGTCTIAAAGSAAPAGNNVTVTFTATGTVGGFNTNSVSTTVTFSRQP